MTALVEPREEGIMAAIKTLLEGMVAGETAEVFPPDPTRVWTYRYTPKQVARVPAVTKECNPDEVGIDGLVILLVPVDTQYSEMETVGGEGRLSFDVVALLPWEPPSNDWTEPFKNQEEPLERIQFRLAADIRVRLRFAAASPAYDALAPFEAYHLYPVEATRRPEETWHKGIARTDMRFTVEFMSRETAP